MSTVQITNFFLTIGGLGILTSPIFLIVLLVQKLRKKNIKRLKKIFLMLFLLCLVSETIGMSMYCNHEFDVIESTPASCTTTGHCLYRCAKCGFEKEEITPRLEHSFIDTDCSSPQVCKICGHTEKPLGHEWEEATCTQAKTCRRCNATSGEPLGHEWAEASCTEAQTCKRCGASQGAALGHTWVEATCTEPRHCTTCGITDGEALGHDWGTATCTDAKICKRCGESEGGAQGHAWVEATCEEAKHCRVCGAVEGTTLGHDWSAATCTTSKTCKRCKRVDGKPLGHDVGEWKITNAQYVDAKVSKERHCSQCGELLESTTEKITSFQKNDSFTLTPDEFGQRMDNAVKEVAKHFKDSGKWKALTESTENDNLITAVGIGHSDVGIIIYGNAAGVMGRKDQNTRGIDVISLKLLADVVESEGNACIAFVMACDPTLSVPDAIQAVSTIMDRALENRAYILNDISYLCTYIDGDVVIGAS